MAQTAVAPDRSKDRLVVNFDAPFTFDLADADAALPAGVQELEEVVAQLAIGDSHSGLEHAAQRRDQSIGLVQEIAERPAARLVQAEGEDVLRRNIGVDGAQLRIEYHDAC